MKITRRQLRRIIREAWDAWGDDGEGGPDLRMMELEPIMYKIIVDTLEESAFLGGGSLDGPLLANAVVNILEREHGEMIDEEDVLEYIYSLEGQRLVRDSKTGEWSLK